MPLIVQLKEACEGIFEFDRRFIEISTYIHKIIFVFGLLETEGIVLNRAHVSAFIKVYSLLTNETLKIDPTTKNRRRGPFFNEKHKRKSLFSSFDEYVQGNLTQLRRPFSNFKRIDQSLAANLPANSTTIRPEAQSSRLQTVSSALAVPVKDSPANILQQKVSSKSNFNKFDEVETPLAEDLKILMMGEPIWEDKFFPDRTEKARSKGSVVPISISNRYNKTSTLMGTKEGEKPLKADFTATKSPFRANLKKVILKSQFEGIEVSANLSDLDSSTCKYNNHPADMANAKVQELEQSFVKKLNKSAINFFSNLLQSESGQELTNEKTVVGCAFRIWSMLADCDLGFLEILEVVSARLMPSITDLRLTSEIDAPKFLRKLMRATINLHQLGSKDKLRQEGKALRSETFQPILEQPSMIETNFKKYRDLLTRCFDSRTIEEANNSFLFHQLLSYVKDFEQANPEQNFKILISGLFATKSRIQFFRRCRFLLSPDILPVSKNLVKRIFRSIIQQIFSNCSFFHLDEISVASDFLSQAIQIVGLTLLEDSLIEESEISLFINEVLVSMNIENQRLNELLKNFGVVGFQNTFSKFFCKDWPVDRPYKRFYINGERFALHPYHLVQANQHSFDLSRIQFNPFFVYYSTFNFNICFVCSKLTCIILDIWIEISGHLPNEKRNPHVACAVLSSLAESIISLDSVLPKTLSSTMKIKLLQKMEKIGNLNFSLGSIPISHPIKKLWNSFIHTKSDETVKAEKQTSQKVQTEHFFKVTLAPSFRQVSKENSQSNSKKRLKLAGFLSSELEQDSTFCRALTAFIAFQKDSIIPLLKEHEDSLVSRFYMNSFQLEIVQNSKFSRVSFFKKRLTYHKIIEYCLLQAAYFLNIDFSKIFILEKRFTDLSSDFIKALIKVHQLVHLQETKIENLKRSNLHSSRFINNRFDPHLSSVIKSGVENPVKPRLCSTKLTRAHFQFIKNTNSECVEGLSMADYFEKHFDLYEDFLGLNDKGLLLKRFQNSNKELFNALSGLIHNVQLLEFYKTLRTSIKKHSSTSIVFKGHNSFNVIFPELNFINSANNFSDYQLISVSSDEIFELSNEALDLFFGHHIKSLNLQLPWFLSQNFLDFIIGTLLFISCSLYLFQIEPYKINYIAYVLISIASFASIFYLHAGRRYVLRKKQLEGWFANRFYCLLCKKYAILGLGAILEAILRTQTFTALLILFSLTRLSTLEFFRRFISISKIFFCILIICFISVYLLMILNKNELIGNIDNFDSIEQIQNRPMSFLFHRLFVLDSGNLIPSLQISIFSSSVIFLIKMVIFTILLCLLIRQSI